jgi:hypothetical protein
MAHLVLTIEDADRVVPLRGVIRIGRHPENDLQVLDAQVSKRHCEVEECEGGFILRDAGTLNGTFVNGRQVRGETRLCHRDLIRIGSTVLSFSDLEEALAQAPALPPLEPRTDIRALTRTAVGVAAIDREQIFRERLHDVLAAESLEELYRVVLAGALALADAEAGAVLARPDAGAIAAGELLEVVQQQGRTREPRDLRPPPDLAERAIASGHVVSHTSTHETAYRIWQPECTIVAPLGHAGRWRALLSLERNGAEPASLEELELLARAAGAALTSFALA